MTTAGTFRGDYERFVNGGDLKEYYEGDTVTYEGQLFVALRDTTGGLGINGPDWESQVADTVTIDKIEDGAITPVKLEGSAIVTRLNGLTGDRHVVSKFNGVTGDVHGVRKLNGLTGEQHAVSKLNGLTGEQHAVSKLNGLTGEQHAVSKFNGATGEVHGVSKLNGLTGEQHAVSKLNGLTGEQHAVSKFNGTTGEVHGVSKLNGLTGEQHAVSKFNGVTGEVHAVSKLNGLTGEQHAVSKFNGITGEIHGVSKVNGLTGEVSAEFAPFRYDIERPDSSSLGSVDSAGQLTFGGVDSTVGGLINAIRFNQVDSRGRDATAIMRRLGFAGGYFELLDSDGGVIFAGTKEYGSVVSSTSHPGGTQLSWPSSGVSGDVDILENQYLVGGFQISSDDEEGTFPIPFLNAASADSGFTAAYFVRIIPNAQEMVPRFNGLTGDVHGVSKFNGTTGEVHGVSKLNGLTGEQHAVSKFNGVTGEVHGVSKLNGSTGELHAVTTLNGMSGTVESIRKNTALFSLQSSSAITASDQHFFAAHVVPYACRGELFGVVGSTGGFKVSLMKAAATEFGKTFGAVSSSVVATLTGNSGSNTRLGVTGAITMLTSAIDANSLLFLKIDSNAGGATSMNAFFTYFGTTG